MKRNKQLNFIRKIDLTATIDIATKHVMPESIDGSLAGLGLCIYVDTSPVVIQISEEQVRLQNHCRMTKNLNKLTFFDLQVTLLNSTASDIIKVMNLVYSPDKVIPRQTQTEVEGLFSDIPKSRSSYTQLLYAEDTTTPSSASTTKEDSDPGNSRRQVH